MPTNVIMPALGVAQQTGTLLKWLKAEGQSVSKGEPLMEIETDKATVEIEAPASGVLAQVLARAGDEVPVGQRIALILAPGESPETEIKSPAPPPTPNKANISAPPPAAKTVQKDIYFTKSFAGGMRRLCLPVRFSRFPPQHQRSPKWAFGCLTDCGQFAGSQSGERGMEHGQ